MIVVVHWSRMFDGKTEEIAEARRFARTVCDGHESADLVELVVSEFGTNAVKHTGSGDPDGLFIVELEIEPDQIRVTVVDMGADTEPSVSLDDPASMVAVSGRGLHIVESVSAKWASEPLRFGRRVWAVITVGA